MEPLMRDHPSFKAALWGSLKRGVSLYHTLAEQKEWCYFPTRPGGFRGKCRALRLQHFARSSLSITESISGAQREFCYINQLVCKTQRGKQNVELGDKHLLS
jgi:hypothetical protein